MKRIGQMLIERNLITEEQLNKGLTLSEEKHIKIGEALIQLGYISDKKFIEVLSIQLGIPAFTGEEIVVAPTVIHTISSEIATKYCIVPIEENAGSLVVATSSPSNTFLFSELEVSLNRRVRVLIATKKQIENAINKYYKGKEGLNESVRNIEEYDFGSQTEEGGESEEDSAIQSGPVVKFVNEMLIGAVKEKASDIHIEKDTVDFHIRYRIDGILKTMFRPKKSLHNMIISRLKVMSKLDVSEHRIPQDGRIKLESDGYKVDFRLAVCPCIDGENAVLRILNSTTAPDISKVGFNPVNKKRLDSILIHHFGLILVAGQTGSGKTTTLYSILNFLNDENTKIITVEDPVEIRLPMINQIQVNTKVNLTFASGLRSILRMDPDVVLVGEIRDTETAKMAVNAAMTGHLVFSTVHCGNTSEIPIRMGEMGVEPYLMTNVLLGAISQRLVRVNCPLCTEVEKVPDNIRNVLGINFESYAGKGCAACGKIGYRGRTVIEEVMVVNEEIRRLIIAEASSSDIEKASIKSGMLTIMESGRAKVRSRITSAAELARVM